MKVTTDKSKNIYLAGCGKIGKRLGERLFENSYQVTGLKRNTADYAFPTLAVDLGDASTTENLPLDADIIVFTVTPSSYDTEEYRHIYETILNNVIDWALSHESLPLLVLVSSTGVYGQQSGEWVDENSETMPTRHSGQWVLAGEIALRQRLKNTLSIRFSGIYGGDRNYLVQSAISGKPIQKIPPMWTNRIHEDDCVGALAFLIGEYQQSTPLAPIYLVSDDAPISRYDVCGHICKQLGHPTPPILTTKLSTQYNKRCDNSRFKALGYVFDYPSYREGYHKDLIQPS